MDLADFKKKHAIIQADEKILLSHEYYEKQIADQVFEAYTDALGEFNDHIIDLESSPRVDHRSSNTKKVNFPPLSLPTFSGKHEEWESFKQLFTSLVIKREMPKAVKLQHLLSVVQGSAQQRLKGIDITDSNFDIAWEKLVRRFDNAQIRLFNHLENLINLPVVKPGNLPDLIQILDKTE
ncbi:uncharacterized protein LOC106643361 [Copidosoma floridanum]|uniref:uncharacterized protein LOC106643361 n=1 Tax=Copidosoma floridanum TaxID=29053 RepID=UPI0006C9CD63|nr:uncharacterized protein LOC106643361 [Copidosoma floridanum]